MKHIKTFNEVINQSYLRIARNQEEYDMILEDIKYILQDIVDEGYTLDIRYSGESRHPLNNDTISDQGVLVFPILIEIVPSSRTKWLSMWNMGGRREGEVWDFINIKDTLLQLDSYVSDYGCKVMIRSWTAYNRYVDMDIDDADLQKWSSGSVVKIDIVERKS